MANFLEKLMPKPPQKQEGSQKLPSAVKTGGVPSLASSIREPLRKLPNASIVYGTTALILVGMALYNFFSGRILTSLLILFPAACFVGYAWFFAKRVS